MPRNVYLFFDMDSGELNSMNYKDEEINPPTDVYSFPAIMTPGQLERALRIANGESD